MSTIDRRGLLFGLAGTGLAYGSSGQAKPLSPFIMTVLGPLPARKAGFTLSHEHLTADLRAWGERPAVAVSNEEIAGLVTPYVLDAKRLGCQTLVDCTASNLGRNPRVLKQVAEATGVSILTCTGLYAAADGRFLPDTASSLAPAALAKTWIKEWDEGIDGSGVRPGLIKLGFNGGPLTKIEQGLIDAAAETHRKTGLIIGSHVGPWRKPDPGANAASTHEQLDRLKAAGISSSALIWFHAQNEPNGDQHLEIAKRGAWISFDGVAPETVEQHTALVVKMKAAGLLERVLVSQDAGWYSLGEPGGGTFRPLSTIFTDLVPRLKSEGLTDREIATIFVHNPSKAFAVRRRLVRQKG